MRRGLIYLLALALIGAGLILLPALRQQSQTAAMVAQTLELLKDHKTTARAAWKQTQDPASLSALALTLPWQEQAQTRVMATGQLTPGHAVELELPHLPPALCQPLAKALQGELREGLWLRLSRDDLTLTAQASREDHQLFCASQAPVRLYFRI
jgi:hypothetical protein